MKSNLFIAEYFEYQICLNIEQGINLWHLLNKVLSLDIPGDVVELGTLSGMTAAVMQRTIEDYGSDKTLYLFDSFDGLPQLGERDIDCPLIPENFKITPDYTVERFEKYGLKQPIIVPGWFNDTLATGLPPQICFAHLDGDLYESIKVSLEQVYPRLAPGALVLVDDYASPEICNAISIGYAENPYSRNSGRKCNPTDWLPGVRFACDEFLADKPEEMVILLAGEERHAYFEKL